MTVACGNEQNILRHWINQWEALSTSFFDDESRYYDEGQCVRGDQRVMDCRGYGQRDGRKGKDYPLNLNFLAKIIALHLLHVSLIIAWSLQQIPLRHSFLQISYPWAERFWHLVPAKPSQFGGNAGNIMSKGFNQYKDDSSISGSSRI